MAAMAPNTVSSPPETPPGSPFRPEPEQPRLGILHLLVWTACVAVYFSIATSFRSDDYVPRLEASLVLAVGVEMGRATALGGLLLLAARRYRRLPFPSQPGETLLVLLGVGSATWLGMRFLNDRAVNAAPMSLLLCQVLAASAMVALGVLYLAAAIRTRSLRWRVYFATVLLGGILSILLPLFLIRGWGPGPNAVAASLHAWLLPFAVLLVVAVKDAAQRPRYRWTHWLGVGIGLWNGAISAAWCAWQLLFRSWLP
jgi:hypothetical protein